MVELSERLSLLTKSFFSTKNIHLSRKVVFYEGLSALPRYFPGQMMVSDLLDPNQGIFAYTEHRKQARTANRVPSMEWSAEPKA